MSIYYSLHTTFKVLFYKIKQSGFLQDDLNKYSKKCQMTYSPVTDRKTLKGQVDNLGWQGCEQMDIFIHHGGSLN